MILCSHHLILILCKAFVLRKHIPTCCLNKSSDDFNFSIKNFDKQLLEVKEKGIILKC